MNVRTAEQWVQEFCSNPVDMRDFITRVQVDAINKTKQELGPDGDRVLVEIRNETSRVLTAVGRVNEVSGALNEKTVNWIRNLDLRIRAFESSVNALLSEIHRVHRVKAARGKKHAKKKTLRRRIR